MMPQIQFAAQRLASIEIWPVALLAAVSVISPRALPWALGAAGLFWIVRYLAYGRLSARTAVDWPVAVLALMLPVSLWVTPLPEITRPAVGYALLGIALLYAMANWAASPARLRLLAAGLLLAGLLLALSAPFSVIRPAATDKLPFVPESVYTRLPHLLPESVHPNVLAGPLAILLPLALALLLFGWRQLPWYGRGLAGVTSLAIVLVLVLTQSRGGLLALGATLIVLTLMRWRRGWLLLVAVAIAAVLAFRYLGADAVITRLTTDDTFGGVEGRLMVWSRALTMIQDFPFTGVGMGTFRPVAETLYALFDSSETLTHAHNLFLQVAVDLGFPGLIAWLATLMLVVVGGWWLYRQGRAAGDGWLSGLGAGLLCSQVALVTHGLVDAVTWGGVRPAVITWAVWGLVTAGWNVYRADGELS
jgi:putative inorganic carbon (HCO3(-)) transporter